MIYEYRLADSRYRTPLHSVLVAVFYTCIVYTNSTLKVTLTLLIFISHGYLRDTHTGCAARGPVIPDLLEVDGVDGAVDALLAPQPPCRLLEHTIIRSTQVINSQHL